MIPRRALALAAIGAAGLAALAFGGTASAAALPPGPTPTPGTPGHGTGAQTPSVVEIGQATLPDNTVAIVYDAAGVRRVQVQSATSSDVLFDDTATAFRSWYAARFGATATPPAVTSSNAPPPPAPPPPPPTPVVTSRQALPGGGEAIAYTLAGASRVQVHGPDGSIAFDGTPAEYASWYAARFPSSPPPPPPPPPPPGPPAPPTPGSSQAQAYNDNIRATQPATWLRIRALWNARQDYYNQPAAEPTPAAVAAFQQGYNASAPSHPSWQPRSLTVDGAIGPSTLAALETVYGPMIGGAPAPPPPPPPPPAPPAPGTINLSASSITFYQRVLASWLNTSPQTAFSSAFDLGEFLRPEINTRFGQGTQDAIRAFQIWAPQAMRLTVAPGSMSVNGYLDTVTRGALQQWNAAHAHLNEPAGLEDFGPINAAPRRF